MRHTLYASILFAVLGVVTWLVPDSHLIAPHVDPAFVLLVMAAPMVIAVIVSLRARHRSCVASDMYAVARRAAVVLLYIVATAVTCGIAWKAWIPLPYLRLPARIVR